MLNASISASGGGQRVDLPNGPEGTAEKSVRGSGWVFGVRHDDVNRDDRDRAHRPHVSACQNRALRSLSEWHAAHVANGSAVIAVAASLRRATGKRKRSAAAAASWALSELPVGAQGRAAAMVSSSRPPTSDRGPAARAAGFASGARRGSALDCEERLHAHPQVIRRRGSGRTTCPGCRAPCPRRTCPSAAACRRRSACDSS